MEFENKTIEQEERKNFRAVLKNMNTTPNKMRIPVNIIRKKSVDEAVSILKFCQKKSSVALLKLLNSVTNNAVQLGSNRKNLFIESVQVGDGTKSKKIMFRARGRVNFLEKKLSNITIILGKKDYGKKDTS